LTTDRVSDSGSASHGISFPFVLAVGRRGALTLKSIAGIGAAEGVRRGAPRGVQGVIPARISVRYRALTLSEEIWFRNETQLTTHE
jgi:hypothetical protein